MLKNLFGQQAAANDSLRDVLDGAYRNEVRETSQPSSIPGMADRAIRVCETIRNKRGELLQQRAALEAELQRQTEEFEKALRDIDDQYSDLTVELSKNQQFLAYQCKPAGVRVEPTDETSVTVTLRGDDD